jgi:deferrochelatase/peroxidase EfeB
VTESEFANNGAANSGASRKGTSTTTTLRLFQLDRPRTDADRTTYSAELSQFHANILKPHGRKAAVHLFLTFKPGKQSEVKQFLGSDGGDIGCRAGGAKAAPQHVPGIAQRRLSFGQGILVSGITNSGFFAGVSKGMQQATKRLADHPPAQWKLMYRKDLHAMLFLAHDHREELTSLAHAKEKEVSGFAQGLFRREEL